MAKIHTVWFGALPLLIVLAACSDDPDKAIVSELSGAAMGTSFNIKIVAPPASFVAEDVQRETERLLADIEQQMSTYIVDSELSRFNAYQSAEWFAVSEELCGVVADALAISLATDGAFDITVGPLVNLWGFGPEGTLSAPPDTRAIDSLMPRIGYAALHADCSQPALRKDRTDLYVDLSGIAKGYGVDRLASLLDAHNISNYLVEIGGELRLRGKNASNDSWAIAIESPIRSGRSIESIVNLTDAAVATSGDYRNFFEHDGKVYSHTIDPRAGYPASHSAGSVTVVAASAAHADALATALLVLGPDVGLAFAEREGVAAYFLVRDNGELQQNASSRFIAQVSNR